MKYLLILALFNGGVHTVPQVYPTREACALAGIQWVDSMPEGAARFHCAIWYDYRGQ